MADATPLNSDPTHARHLLRRTGFGATQAQVDEFNTMTRGEAASRLLSFKPQGFKPGGRDGVAQHNKWIKYMLKVPNPLQEKLVLFWHDHFATAISKVRDVKLMGRQNQLLRLNCKGHFGALVKLMNKDPAMMEYLDTVRNHKEIPNENYARELQELFTLGVKDANGNDNYTQADIVNIARAFTGWDYEKGEAFLKDYDHDFYRGGAGEYPERGPKVIYRSTGGFGPGGRDYSLPNDEGAGEIDAIVDIILQHRDSDGKNTVARRIARRLCEYFAHADPDQRFVDDVVALSGFDGNWDVSGLLHQIFVHDVFYETASPASAKRSVTWPVDYVVTTLRLLKVKPKGSYVYIDGGSYSGIFDQLTNMGQTLLDPPSVFGWDWEMSWISSQTLLARYNFARDVIQARWGGGTALHPEKFIDPGLIAAGNTVTPGAIVDAVTSLLGVKDYLNAAERSVLEDYLTDNNTVTPDLTNYGYFQRKLHGLIVLVLESPAYHLH